MADSFRKTPILGLLHPKGSEKKDKRIANRGLRRVSRQLLACARDYDALVLPVMREQFDVWSFSHDGKRWIRFDHTEKPWVHELTRRHYAKAMRK